VGRHSFKAAQPGYHYSTDQGEPRIRGSTTPAPVSYLVAHKCPAAVMSWRPQGKNYVQENSAKSRGYTMYLDESITSVSQPRRGARAYRPLAAPRRNDLDWGPEPEVICNPQPLTLTTFCRPVEDVARLELLGSSGRVQPLLLTTYTMQCHPPHHLPLHHPLQSCGHMYVV